MGNKRVVSLEEKKAIDWSNEFSLLSRAQSLRTVNTIETRHVMQKGDVESVWQESRQQRQSKLVTERKSNKGNYYSMEEERSTFSLTNGEIHQPLMWSNDHYIGEVIYCQATREIFSPFSLSFEIRSVVRCSNHVTFGQGTLCLCFHCWFYHGSKTISRSRKSSSKFLF